MKNYITGTQKDGIRLDVRDKTLEKFAKPSTVVAISQDQDENLQYNRDEYFIDCSTKLEFVGMPILS